MSAIEKISEWNNDESQVPAYDLPELLRTTEGLLVTTPAQWQTHRRQEILSLFTQHVYGKMPSQLPDHVRYETVEEGEIDLPFPAIRRQITIHLSHHDKHHQISLLQYLPRPHARHDTRHQKAPVPVFVGLNFHGNHTVHADPAIALARGWVRNLEQTGVTDNQATELGRGTFAGRWDVNAILENGYGLITAYYGDIFPDHEQGYEQSILKLFSNTPAQRNENDCGAIGAWSWGLSRIMDFIEASPDLVSNRAIVLGHSRLGKAALWAGATDQRFAITISNNSGCVGASLSRRLFGESVEKINTTFPHWFCPGFQKYNKNVSQLPVDQHMLLALIAPRPLYVASAHQDQWADPRGEFLSSQHAVEAYALFGLDEPKLQDMPQVHQPVGNHVGYHMRAGVHGVTAYDWQQFIQFANRHL